MTNDPEILAPHPDDKSPLLDAAAKKAHPKESGHWYSRDGQQVLEVPRANGEGTTRTTLAHARKMDLAPGVTTIIGCADKPALVNWMVDQAILAALTLPRTAAETEAEYLRRVKEDSKAQAAAAAEEGTRIHAAIQSAIQGEPVGHAYLAHVEAVQRLLPKDGGPWEAERTVCHPSGYGTKADMRNAGYLLDFKSKDGDQDTLDGLTTYDEHAMQLAATAKAILHSVPESRYPKCGILFVSRTHPGAASLRMVGEADLDRGWDMFKALLTYWQAKTRHSPWRKEF